MKNARFILTAQAQDDLDSIGAYTLERWGTEQVISYLSRIDATFEKLCLSEANDRDASEIRPGLLSVRSGSHVVFFNRRENGDAIVLRILHQRMDFRRHL
ncbi:MULTISPECIES: type II toxin-antitoxin system RelE/ParE family toxin [unclassified Minwuia]|uniref:type II toxin-antitoxin system RelE/ParE family toxin n=1 Tax=unclassified Minwuia TaxID=2618799 RepID=UPI002478B339|nr:MULTISPECIES: type II toxin-antitoxin system RelE/ParE family toxin [unclassified Minwuia]